MPRPRLVDRPVLTRIYLPESIAARIDLMLFSDLEGRVPYAARTRFFIEAAEEKLKGMTRKESAAPTIGDLSSLPGGAVP